MEKRLRIQRVLNRWKIKMANLTIDIIGKCNLGCEFCYQDLDGSQLSVDEVLTHVKNINPDTVEIGGGEPMLYGGLFKILREITETGRKAHVSTNGTFIPEGMLSLEEEVRTVTTIQISLHAGNPELYKQVTGKDLFDRVIKNIGLLRKHYTVLLTAAVYQRNVDHVHQIVQVAEKLGVPLRVNLAMPVGKGKDVELVDRGALQQLRSYLFAERLQGRDISSPLLHFNNCIAITDAYGIAKKGLCPLDCGKRYVDPRGQVRGCEFVEVEKWD